MIATAAAVAALTLSVAPERLSLPAGGHALVTVRAPGRGIADVRVGTAGYRLDLRGRPLLDDRVRAWLRVRPRRLVVRPGGVAAVRVDAVSPRGARPGDHSFAVVLTVGPPGASVRVRVGVAVVVRVPGAVRRRLRVVAVRRLGRTRVRAVLANLGDVDELLDRPRVILRVWRRGRLVTTLRGSPRRVLARSRTAFEWRVRPLPRGPLVAWLGLGATRVAVLRL